MDIKKNVDQGEALRDFDMDFLEQVFKDARQNDHYTIFKRQMMN